ncbi:MAG: hypothetical protein LUE29_10650, partial [Lachnospiraceae bacterium]|nr:hypothetical protein [Lachnospiraceae bacterium]
KWLILIGSGWLILPGANTVSYNGALDSGVVKPRGILERLAMLSFGALMVLGGILCIFSPILSLFS